MCVFWVLKKNGTSFLSHQVRVNGRKTSKSQGGRVGVGGLGRGWHSESPNPASVLPSNGLFSFTPQEPLGPSPTAQPGPWRRKSCAALCPHPQLPLPAVVLPSWQPSLSALTHSHSPHENQATASWIILKASEAGRTWQHPACSPSSLSGSHCRLLYKARLSRHPPCPSLLLPALGSMDR